MKNLPSKELLSEVLGKEVTTIQKGCTENELKITAYFGDVRQSFYINIYELAHKYKEWAYRQGYVLLSGYSAYGVGLFFCSCKGWLSENYDKQIEITHNTEPEAIFKACQWILDNKD